MDMIGENWLANVIFTTVESKADLSEVKNSKSGDFQASALSKAVNTEETNEITVRAWMARAQSRKSTLVFCVDLAHVSSLTRTFRKYGFDARFVTGNTAKTTRSELLDAFRNGEYPVLLNCGVFTEGTDIPNVDCVLLARPTRSRNLLVQMIGRGMRLHPGKENCHVIDMVASLETGIVTVPTLFGLDPSELVKEASVMQLKELRDSKESEIQREKLPTNLVSDDSLISDGATKGTLSDRKITFTDYDSVHDLIEDTSGERYIRAISQLAWVQVDQDRYVLTMLDGAYLTITKDDTSSSLYTIVHTPRVPLELITEGKWRPFKRNRQVATAETFADAVHAADTFAAENTTWHIISKNQAWRQAPATTGQLAFLNKLRDASDQLTSDRVSKGKAADMITKIKHGAKGRLYRIQAGKRREMRAEEKLAQSIERRQREEVRVGPLAE